MATPPMPTPSPDQQGGGAAPAGGAPPPAGPPPPPDQGGQGGPPPSSFTPPGDNLTRLLAQWMKVAEQMAAADPRLASGAQKIRDGITDMQNALVTPPQPTPMAQQPRY